jgi:glycosyltransferase involved in cell wall biosynthesis
MKNIIYLCTHNPFEIQSGAHQRSNLLCKALAEIAYVDVVCFTGEDILIEESNIPNCAIVYLEKEKIIRPSFIKWLFLKINFFSNQILSPQNIYCTNKIRSIMKEKDYDYVVVRYITTAIKYGLRFDKKVIIDVDDLPEQVYKSYIKNNQYGNVIEKITKNLYCWLLIKAAKFHTKKITNKVEHAFIPNKKQLSLFSNALYLPNIPYPVQFNEVRKNPLTGNFELMFVGRLSYRPNFEGIDYFLKHIWTVIIRQIPQAHFNIIGSLLPDEKKQYWKTCKGVNIIGYVEDIVAEYEKNSVVVVPVYLGAGTNIKVLEAMSMGKACVITQYAGRGFEDLLIDGNNILIAENDNDFAAKVIQLLTDYNLNQRIGKNAKNALNAEYSYNSFRKTVQYAIHNS